ENAGERHDEQPEREDDPATAGTTWLREPGAHAGGQVGRRRELDVRGQRAELELEVGAAHAATSPSWVRSRSRARESRDFTVPRAMPSAAAVSSSDSSRKYRQLITSRSSSRNASTASSNCRRRSDATSVASGDGAAPPEGPSPAARSARRSRRPADRRRLRASLPTISSSQGLNGAPVRKRPRARKAFTNPSWAASSASAAEPART